MYHNMQGPFRGWVHSQISSLLLVAILKQIGSDLVEIFMMLPEEESVHHRSPFRPFRILPAFPCYSFPPEAHETCVNSRAPWAGTWNRTVDSAAFHKERLFRCVDDITFLPAGPRYIVNIRAGGAHFSDEILRKNRHFDVIHVCNSTYWQQQRCAIRGWSISLLRMYISRKNSRYQKRYLFIHYIPNISTSIPRTVFELNVFELNC